MSLSDCVTFLIRATLLPFLNSSSVRHCENTQTTVTFQTLLLQFTNGNESKNTFFTK